jgi:hypothetical protein
MRTRTHLLLLVGAMTLMPATTRAQTSLGIKGGLSYATLSNKSPDFDNRTGFAAGIALDMRSGLIGLQPELLYVQKGVTSSGTPSGSAPKLDYAEIPVLVKLTLGTPGVQPMIYAGPSVGFRLTCQVMEIDCASGTIKSTDWGAVLGGGLRIGGNKGLTIEGRYTWGLKDIHDISSGVDQKTRTFLALVGFSL